MKLYWVTTEDHCEDWFVVAQSPVAAARFHETAEGYERGEASAEEILAIPDEFNAVDGWPTDELISDLGGTFINVDHPRVVAINGKKYCEGLLEAIIRDLDDEQDESGQQKTHDANVKH
jgi:hypothetical protein